MHCNSAPNRCPRLVVRRRFAPGTYLYCQRIRNLMPGTAQTDGMAK
ncbi:hypothetical protein TcasGA2_TC032452 [Tribolium castaneum]|uniref:Uncharacterized protein n=1 Tax=Tribolium castaneum TaxID=7070 RepID=A0A139WLD7_TRICA|nr:hypothetical protein TcasGA2_TC032452 [Tribolium castaneum]